MDQKKYDMIGVLGPTASGKTAFAAHLADRMKGEIISADSRQVYRKMDIGTGKDYGDYLVGNKRIPFHLIDILEPGERYNVYQYQKDFLRVYRDIQERGRMPVLCGGSGLYIEAVLKGYRLIPVPPDHKLREELSQKSLHELVDRLKSESQDLHNTTDLTSKKRAIRALEIARYYSAHPEEDVDFPPIKPFILGVKYDRPAQRRRITERLKQRLEAGMVEEVRSLMRSGLTRGDLEYYGLEYRYLARYLEGELSYEAMFEYLNTAIHQFAKRQMTWFRRMQRNGITIHWLDGHKPLEDKLEKAEKLLKESRDFR
jgi:tRNA dimethylallyltransferase